MVYFFAGCEFIGGRELFWSNDSNNTPRLLLFSVCNDYQFRPSKTSVQASTKASEKPLVDVSTSADLI